MIASGKYPGSVFHPSIDGKRSPATVTVEATGLRAQATTGQTFELPFAGMQVEMGGSSGKMIFCRSPDRALTIISEDPELPPSLMRVAPPALSRTVEALVASRRRTQALELTAVAAVLAVLIAAALATPAALRYAATSVVGKLPYSVDKTIGKVSIESMDIGGPVADDPALEALAGSLLERLKGPVSQLVPDLEPTFEIRVVTSKQTNAFALPGGQIVLYTGLVAAAHAPEEVAAVLAHEMSHVVRRHGLRRMAQSLGVIGAISLLFGDATGLAAVAGDLVTVAAVNDYSQDQESEADADAARVLAAASIDPVALANFFTLLQAESEVDDALAMVPWLSSHPDLEARIHAAKAASERAAVKPRTLDVEWAQAKRVATKLTEK